MIYIKLGINSIDLSNNLLNLCILLSTKFNCLTIKLFFRILYFNTPKAIHMNDEQFSLIENVNYWQNAPKQSTYIRKSYVASIINHLGNHLVKVLVWQRRCGKSTILKQVIAYLLPPTYIFEAMRASVASPVIQWNLIGISLVGDIIFSSKAAEAINGFMVDPVGYLAEIALLKNG